MKLIRLFGNNHAQINWTLADQAVVSASNFFTALVVARYLGIEAFGVFSVVWLIVLFVQSLQIALILMPMLSIGSKKNFYHQVSYYAALWTLQLVFALISAIVAALLAAYGGLLVSTGETGATLALPLALTVIASQLHEFVRRACFMLSKSATALLIDIVRYIGQFTMFYYLFARGYGNLANAFYAVAISALLGLPVVAWQLPMPAWRLAQILAAAKHHWNMSKWLVPSALMQWTSSNFFTLVAGALLGPVAVGAMRAAQNLMGVTHVFFQAMENWATVHASRIYAQYDMARLRVFTHKLLMVSGGTTMLVVLLFAVPSKFWFTLLYGEEYAPYDWLVVCYGAVYVLVAVSAPLRYSLVALENTRSVFFGYAITTIISAIVVYPLITTFGLLGAMLGIFITQVAMLINFIISYRNRVGIVA